MGFFLILKVINNAKVTRAKTIQSVLSTPIQSIEKPANNAPVTVAAFHVLLLHVAAFG